MNSAQQILNQLGGNRFIAMTGAKMFTQDQNALNFRLPTNFATKGINHVRVELNGKDLYNVRFGKVRGLNFTVIATVTDVYADSLQRTFTDATGLDTKF